MDNLSRVSVIFFGTSDFAVPALKKLAFDSNYQIKAVITQPDKPAGRKQKLSASPVKIEAEKLGLKVIQPPHLTSPTRGEEKGGLFPPLDGEGEGGVDIFIVASYGKIIPKSILKIPKYGVLNIHPSLLPKYRGPSPIQAAILNGDDETGVTIMKLDEEMDHGPVVASSKFKVDNSEHGYKKLHDELADMGAGLLVKILPEYISGKTKPVPQDHSKATFTKIITKTDGRIDWKKSAEEIDRQIRAYESWPVAWTTLDGKRLKIFEAAPADIPAEARTPSLIPGMIRDDNGPVFAFCRKSAIEIKTLQFEGAKKIPAREFANGYRGLSGKILQ